MNSFTGISTVCFPPKNNNTCTCMHAIHDVRSQLQLCISPGRLHGRGRVTGRLHGSNVLTCCTWARARRVGVFSDGRYYGLLRYVSALLHA